MDAAASDTDLEADAHAQQHGQAYVPRLLEHVQRGELTPAAMATHRFPLEDSPKGYHMFKHKEDGCIRAVFAP